MRILMVAAESTPFVKTGGLGEVVGSLARALRKRGHDTRIVIPFYSVIPSELKETVTFRMRWTMSLSWRQQSVGLYEHHAGHGVTYFIENAFYFARDAIYGMSGTYDEGERFAFFSRAVLEALLHLEWVPDVVHLHDWQAALVPFFHEHFYRDVDKLKGVRYVLTVHNLKYQGIFPPGIVGDVLGVGPEVLRTDDMEYYGQANFLKAGLVRAHRVTTVSPTYAEEIRHPYYGEGLDGLFRVLKPPVVGILNGIDLEDYDPAQDPHVFVPYTDLQGKRDNKRLLLESMGLQAETSKMLMVMVSRLVEQKGIDLVLHILSELFQRPVVLMILGSGEAHYEAHLKQAEAHFPRQIRVMTGYNEGLARKLYAAADVYLMPSRFEPCGISQMIAMRYLAVPLVRLTGGLVDTVQPYNPLTGTGVGVTFYEYNAHALLDAVDRVLQLYDDETDRHFYNMTETMRRRPLGWDRSAVAYEALYRSLFPEPPEDVPPSEPPEDVPPSDLPYPEKRMEETKIRERKAALRSAVRMDRAFNPTIGSIV
ncbi:MAG: Glycogen synthase, ADP-glucose transglucosylase [Candidatus Carbobacillus altaicus]|uniref:Glycogen synthase n=1 Tax=Candidatus Carbonibacillus altaicus TaxID=2163959 RepID=A0A2R6Y5G8_9BACL|nr:MAG: Glycogen synthase, ADP-glucose transglucosylase [Candidatus Carbobacillus altaicus]